METIGADGANANKHCVPSVTGDVRAHQDYAVVTLIAKVPRSFNKHVFCPFSLLTGSYAICSGLNTSCFDMEVRALLQLTSAQQKAPSSLRGGSYMSALRLLCRGYRAEVKSKV